MNAPHTARPGAVTLVVVLVWISALLEIIAGVVLLVLALTASPSGAGGAARGVLTALGIIALLIGLLTAAVATRLGKGGNGARIIVTVLTVLQVAGGLASIIRLAGTSGAVSSLWVNVAVGVVILLLLWNSRANTYFAR